MRDDNFDDQAKADNFDRIATEADVRAEMYKQFGMHRSAEAAANTAAKARVAATAYRPTNPNKEIDHALD